MFEVKSVHLEPGVEVTNDLVAGLAGVLRETAAWHRTPELVVRETNPTGLKKLLQARL
jgi:hypothetical protein